MSVDCRAVCALLPALMILGCKMQHEMELRPEGHACPAVDEAAASWLVPQRSGDQETLGRWCTTVGPPIIDSLPAATFGALEDDDSLAVVTWNVHGGAGDLLELIDLELDLSCSTSQATRGGRFAHFVLLLQEAYRRSPEVPPTPAEGTVPRRLKEERRPGPRIDVVEVARRCGLSLVYIPSMRNGDEEYDDGREDRGNAILSTLPLSDLIAIELPFEAQRRVAVAATVHGPAGDSLRVVSVHLDVASSLLRLLHTGNSTRQRQGLGLIDALREIELQRAGPSGESELASCYPECPPGSAPRYTISTIAAGDFNTWSAKETVIKHLYRHFPQSAAWDGQATRGSYPTDFIFFRQGEGASTRLPADSQRRIDDRHHSDHRARIGWVGFR
jgi:endonuclease/exonuclease/phosphatase family metal-dependent hydrolase